MQKTELIHFHSGTKMSKQYYIKSMYPACQIQQQIPKLWKLLFPSFWPIIYVTGEQNESMHTACISFWITKRQSISTDTSFVVKMIVKLYAIDIIFRSQEPFQSYLLTGQA